jgi:hypothetical protein
MSKKFKYLVLEVNHVEFEMTDEYKKERGITESWITTAGYTQSCTVKDQVTNEIYHIDRDTDPQGELLKIINTIDFNDLIVGDQFHLSYPFIIEN